MESMGVFLPLIVVMGAFMFFASRRQRKAMQATIVGITDDTVDLEIAPGVVTTWMKLAIRDKITPEDLNEDADTPREISESDAIPD